MNKSIKNILVLNYEFPPLGGGGGVATYKLAKGFIELGYNVDYITSHYDNLAKHEVVDGINVYRVPVLGRKNLATASLLSLLTYPISGFVKGFTLCRQKKYKFINTQFVIPTGPLGWILSKLFKIKNVISLHGGDIYDPTKKLSPHRHWFLCRIITFLLNQGDRIVAQSSNTISNTIKYYHPNKTIQLIPLPYEIVPFKPITRSELGLKENKKYIIGVGRLVERKGFDYFIKALALLDKDIEGIIIGYGPEKEKLQTLANDLNISDRLHFLHVPSEERKFQYLSCADVYVLSSLHEGFGIVLQEAMQTGLPIIATNHGGQVDLIKDGINGFLVGIEDESQIAQKVRMTLGDVSLKQKFSDYNFIQIKNFSLKSIAQKYEAIL